MMMTPTTCLGFNPCSGGSIALGLWVGAALPSPPLCFNPCSGGSIALGFPALPARFASYACFNPCSGGSIALGDRCHRPRPHTLRFQSLFWWKYCPGGSTGPGGEDPNPPVSILVLVEVLPWGSLGRNSFSVVQGVSILVLVEVLPWEEAEDA